MASTQHQGSEEKHRKAVNSRAAAAKIRKLHAVQFYRKSHVRDAILISFVLIMICGEGGDHGQCREDVGGWSRCGSAPVGGGGISGFRPAGQKSMAATTSSPFSSS